MLKLGLCILQVRQLLGRPLPRTFDPPRRLQLVSPGAGLRIVAPPVQVDTMPSNVRTLILHIMCYLLSTFELMPLAPIASHWMLQPPVNYGYAFLWLLSCPHDRSRRIACCQLAVVLVKVYGIALVKVYGIAYWRHAIPSMHTSRSGGQRPFLQSASAQRQVSSMSYSCKFFASQWQPLPCYCPSWHAQLALSGFA